MIDVQMAQDSAVTSISGQDSYPAVYTYLATCQVQLNDLIFR